jgi:cathepsin L
LLALALCAGFISAAPAATDYATREQQAPPLIKGRLTRLRGVIASHHYTFTVGYTTALDHPLAQLTGAIAPPGLAAQAGVQNQTAVGLSAIGDQAMTQFKLAHPGWPAWPATPVGCVATLPAFDWRSLNKVTPVRDQECADCWAYGTVAAYESSFLINDPWASGKALDLSEPEIVNCSGAGSCSGGWWAFQYIEDTGTCARTAFRQPAGASCVTVSTPYRAISWGYVDPAGGIPTVDQMKQALCDHGPLAVAVNATPAFQAYTGGVFDENVDQPGTVSVNHAVAVIGWDDGKQAWLIKNSWGTGWGNDGGNPAWPGGFMWIHYGADFVGYGAAWVDARAPFLAIPRHWFDLEPAAKPLPAALKTAPQAAVLPPAHLVVRPPARAH